MYLDLTNVEAKPSTIPDGKYLVTITAASDEANKTNTGRYLKLEFSVTDGQHKGRKVWERYNYQNTNPQAVEIAQQNLKTLCVACNAPDKIQTPQVFIGLECVITLKTKDDAQRVVAYTSKKDFTPTHSVQTTAQAVNQAPRVF